MLYEIQMIRHHLLRNGFDNTISYSSYEILESKNHCSQSNKKENALNDAWKSCARKIRLFLFIYFDVWALKATVALQSCPGKNLRFKNILKFDGIYYFVHCHCYSHYLCHVYYKNLKKSQKMLSMK